MNHNQKISTAAFLLGLLVFARPIALQAQYEYTTNADGISLTITGYSGPGGAVTIPDNINGLTVTNIGTNAFYYAISLTSVVIPDSVTNIGPAAFYVCSNLTSVTIPSSVFSIGNAAFEGCYSLTNLTIPGSVISIGEFAFELCEGLTNVTIPPGVTSIGEEAFDMCGSLTSVSIPASVTNIGQLTFFACPLTNITIPASVTNIGSNAFAYCTDLSSVFFAGNAPTIPVNAPPFNETGTVYYLPGTTGWSNTFSGRPAVPWNPQIQTGGPGFGEQNNQFGFNITGTSNIPIVVQASANLASPVWTPLQSLTLTNGLFYFSEPLQTNGSGRFYRISAP